MRCCAGSWTGCSRGIRRSSTPNPIRWPGFEGLFMASFEAIDTRHAQVVIYQDEAGDFGAAPVRLRRRTQPRAAQDVASMSPRSGHQGGLFPADLDVDLRTGSSATLRGCRCAGISPVAR